MQGVMRAKSLQSYLPTAAQLFRDVFVLRVLMVRMVRPNGLFAKLPAVKV